MGKVQPLLGKNVGSGLAVRRVQPPAPPAPTRSSPAARTPMRRATTSSPRHRARRSSPAARAATCGTPTATSSSSTAWACARDARPRLPAGGRRRVPRSCAEGTNFTRPAAIELECAERLLELVAGGRDGEVRQERLDVTTAARPARPRVHRPRPRRGLRRAPVLLHRRLVHRHDRRWTAASPADKRPDRRLSLQRPRQPRALFDAHPGQIACVVLEAVASTEPPRRIPRRPARALPTARRRARLRRDDHRLPLALRRRATSTASRPTCPASARRSPTASRCRRSPAGPTSWRSAAATPSGSVCSCCPPRTAPRARARRGDGDLDVYEREPVIEHLLPAGRAAARGLRAAAPAGSKVPRRWAGRAQPDLRHRTRDGEPSQAFRTLVPAGD